jgi:Arc/MetJ family transcription regulator
MMRTTIAIDDNALTAAATIARQRHQAVGKSSPNWRAIPCDRRW